MDNADAFAFELISVASATIATSFTSTVYKPAGANIPVRKATIYVNAGPIINITVDGTTVTTGTGHALTSFMTYNVFGAENIKNFRTTSTKSGTAGSISVTYFR